MTRIITVAKREYLETVKSKVFILNLVLTPLLVVGGIFLSTRMTQKTMEGPRPVKVIAVTDLTGQAIPELLRLSQEYNKFNPQREILLTLSTEGDASHTQELKDKVQRGELAAFLLISKDALGSGKGKSYCYVKALGMTDMDLYSTVQRMINDAIVTTRFRQKNLPPELYAELHRYVPFEQVDLGAKPQEKRDPLAMLMAPFFFLFLMFTGIIAVNQQIMTSVIEEKNSRVMEVILSAVSPFQLMSGKILGLAGAGLTLVFFWGVTAYGAAAYRGMTAVVTVANLTYFVLYYILGFLLISSILAAIGSVCNTMKEAQSMMMPVMIIFILPMFMWFYIAQHPQAPLSIALSFIPPITPMIMILRIASNPEIPFIQILASFLVLGASVPAVMWASAKVFRTGILMYGKPPSLRELLRWLRYS